MNVCAVIYTRILYFMIYQEQIAPDQTDMIKTFESPIKSEKKYCYLDYRCQFIYGILKLMN